MNTRSILSVRSIFFIGFPLGVYWVRRSKKAHPLAAIARRQAGGSLPMNRAFSPVEIENERWSVN